MGVGATPIPAADPETATELVAGPDLHLATQDPEREQQHHDDEDHEQTLRRDEPT
jgi:hypothetical protein